LTALLRTALAAAWRAERQPSLTPPLTATSPRNPPTPPPPLSALARKNGYQLAYNQEIVGLGLANFAGALFSSYTTTGSFSRSAVNNNSGGARDRRGAPLALGGAAERGACQPPSAPARWACARPAARPRAVRACTTRNDPEPLRPQPARTQAPRRSSRASSPPSW
jgi:hypothetical protein